MDFKQYNVLKIVTSCCLAYPQKKKKNNRLFFDHMQHWSNYEDKHWSKCEDNSCCEIQRRMHDFLLQKVWHKQVWYWIYVEETFCCRIFLAQKHFVTKPVHFSCDVYFITFSLLQKKIWLITKLGIVVKCITVCLKFFSCPQMSNSLKYRMATIILKL